MLQHQNTSLLKPAKILPKKILLVDDDPSIRQTLAIPLQRWGYAVLEANDGQEALDIINDQEIPPEIIIVDWIMPNIDGIHFCQYLKEKTYYHPYIIMITQVSGVPNVVKALEAGADEFLNKPIDISELRSRIGVGEKILNVKNILLQQNEEFQKYLARIELLVEERAREILLNTDFIMMLGKLASQISEQITEFLQSFEDTNPLNSTKELLVKVNKQRISGLHNNLKYVINLIQTLQTETIKFSRQTSFCNLNEAVIRAVDLCQIALRNIKIDYLLQEDLPEVFADKQQLEQAFLGLILNACELLKQQNEGFLKIETSTIKDKHVILLMIEASGPKIKASELGNIFQPYWGFESGDNAKLKMSVALCRNILQKFGGTLRIEARKQGGLRFIVDLPSK